MTPHNAQGQAIMTEDQTSFTPIYVPESTTFDRIACRTGASFSGTATVRLGIYNNSAGKPTTVVLDAGTVSCTASATVYTITISQTLDVGWYWLAFNSQTNATTNNFATSNQALIDPFFSLSSSGLIPQTRYQQSSVTGAFATTTGLSTNTGAPILGLRKEAI
jgi:hypothetical protein